MRESLIGIGVSRGSKIIVTTRSEIVTSTMQTSFTHRLVRLSYDDSWTIFKQNAFAHGGPEETPNLVIVGQRILKECGGVPLAIKTLGGLMRSKKNENDWLLIERSEIWNSSEITRTDILPSLMLSFNHLPSSSLRQCFAYCSLFGKGVTIGKDYLITHWMAQGYLQPTRGSNMMMEDVGNYYFDVLLWNSLFQDVQRDEYNKIKGCKMHDLVHDLARHVAESFCFASNSGEVQHLTLTPTQGATPCIPKEGSQKLRSLYSTVNFSGDILMDFTWLRELTLGTSGIGEVPSSISKMIHLRYLDLSGTHIKVLPNFIPKLYNLQTLVVLNCLLLEKLPREFTNLINLRHFYMDDDEKHWNLMPKGIGQLTSLQTLPFFKIGQDNENGIEELGCLGNLKGVVKIYCLEHVKNKEDARKANLSRNGNIHELRFNWSSRIEETINMDDDEDILEGLETHKNLQGLVIENFGGRKLASWMMGRDHTSLLYNLVKIELRCCKRLEEVPALGYLPFLKILSMVGIHNMKCIGTEFYGPHILDDGYNETTMFRVLRELTLQDMPGLVEWCEVTVSPESGWSVGSMFPCLEVLKIKNCPELIMAPSQFPCLKKLLVHNTNSVALRKMSTNLTSLTFLELENVSGLEIHFVLEKMLKNNRSQLRDVMIKRCVDLSHVPNELGDLVSLETLEILLCKNLTTVPDIEVENNSLASLRILRIYGAYKLTCLPKGLGNLTSLENLELHRCPNLTGINPPDMLRLTSLKAFGISYCGTLRVSNCWPEWLLSLTPGLRILTIGGFSEELDYFPWPPSTGTIAFTCTNSGSSSSNRDMNITQQVQPQNHLFLSLKHLLLWGWTKLTSLPDQLQHLTALLRLAISNFDGVETLPDWLGNLASLQDLQIRKCNNLKKLPSVNAMERLTNLQWLQIERCPVLEERCTQGSRPEWHKISHIPSIKIDNRR